MDQLLFINRFINRVVSYCRDDLVDLVGSYQFDDEKTEGLDVFARDPYILRFRCLNTGDRLFVVITVLSTVILNTL